MNDTGVHESIREASDNVENSPAFLTTDNKEEKKQFFDSGWLWIAATGCPLIAGTFGPVASAFNICAVSSPWREHIPPGQLEDHGERIQDPAWLLAINSVSLFFALLANLALLLNMARRLSYAIAQTAVIVGFSLAAGLLVILLGITSRRSFKLSPPAEHALTQAYYYALISAILYAIIVILMVFSVFGTITGRYKKEFELNNSQRALMMVTILFVGYLLLGSLVFSHIEHWLFEDAVYWATFTVLTVGIGGNFVPATHLGRSLLFPYAIGGLLLVGLVIGSVRSLALERGRAKLEARVMEKTRVSTIENLDPYTDSRIKIGMYHTFDYRPEGLNEFQRREQEFKLMRCIQELAEKRRMRIALAISIASTLLLWFMGALVFMIAERDQSWSYFVSLYFSYTTLLTIGYGDFQPISNSGKPFLVIWSFLAVPTLTILISHLGETVVSSLKEVTLWLGSVTALQSDGSLRGRLRSSIKKLDIMPEGGLQLGKLQEPPGYLPGKDAKPSKDDTLVDRMAKHIEDEEFSEIQGSSNDQKEDHRRDVHFYHFLLAREIRQVMEDVDKAPDKRYSYKDWAYYLKMMGHAESDPSAHKLSLIDTKTSKELSHGKEGSEDVKTKSWSWIGSNSPLMSGKNEPEWLLSRLLITLEQELRRMNSVEHVHQLKKPPVSRSDLKNIRESKN